MLGAIGRWLGFGQQSRTRAQPPGASPMLRARYDAAQTTDDNRRHWAAADLLSAASANSPAVRRTLRTRSRYEVANNSYAKGIVLTLANDRIGKGPRLQLDSPDEQANAEFEQAFAIWAKEVGLAEKLRTMSHAYDVDGEGLGVLTTNPTLTTPVKLDIKLVECDRLSNPPTKAMTIEGQMHDGIEFDVHGNPTHYHIADRHPGDPNFAVWRRTR
jgi:capsid protein